MGVLCGDELELDAALLSASVLLDGVLADYVHVALYECLKEERAL